MVTDVQSDTPIGWMLAALIALHLFLAIVSPAGAATFGVGGL